LKVIVGQAQLFEVIQEVVSSYTSYFLPEPTTAERQQQQRAAAAAVAAVHLESRLLPDCFAK
jgi:hypothetical protein